ncbi:type VI secretion system Vgr family protein [Polyangium jinanense]|uniref:Type VI secretion system tip protein VgrG n=1 Tax=Polyangium jinanense TaxID=2829994 RepID=A0A9X3XCE2_9BACT|nr:type VI secretion system tip protein TssI/VgrG [Polyangium jinanense]MDC3959505.1 type VI secretion system tip protein VgrG [Polyangium jinanense]MDC3986103.1 type VI secretion system tip protein VgrG [Polyangium jinanense]
MVWLPSIRLPGGTLSLVLDSQTALDVRRFSIAEGISSLFSVTLEAFSSDAALSFDDVVGQRARFTIRRGAEERTWSGICCGARLIRVEEDGLSTYEITLVPMLWLLTQRVNRRIFQHLSEPEIATRLLDDWQIPRELRLSETYKPRELRTQYDESDHAFLCRQLEDAGISYFFEEKDGETVVVLSDAPHRAEPRPTRLPFKADVTMVTGEYATRAQAGRELRPGRFVMRDRDHRLSAAYPLEARADARALDVETRLERFRADPGAFLYQANPGGGTPVADDRGAYRSDERVARSLAQKRLEAEREGAVTFGFDTNALDLAPGVVVHVDGHPRPEFARGLLVVGTRLDGTQDGDWTHVCEARSVELPYRPPRVTPTPRAQSIETATVVGPHGEEIHCDEFGRVRVHFHWDRESTMDEQSSCWIPVSQAWSGAGYGALNLPRVDQEVLVAFLDGVPDRPMIVGRVHTALQKVPYSLPASKTQSGWRTASSPGGNGYNEILFEDKKGGEFIRVHAERDMHATVQRDMVSTVQRDQTETVRRDRKAIVTRDAETIVGRNAAQLVQDNARQVVGLSSTRVVGVNDVLDVGGDQNVSICGDHNLSVGGSSETKIAGAHSVQVGATQIIQAGDTITIKTGAASITLEPSGKVTISGTEIVLQSTGPVTASGTKIGVSGAEIGVLASGAAEVGGASLHLVGDPIKSN